MNYVQRKYKEILSKEVKASQESTKVAVNQVINLIDRLIITLPLGDKKLPQLYNAKYSLIDMTQTKNYRVETLSQVILTIGQTYGLPKHQLYSLINTGVLQGQINSEVILKRVKVQVKSEFN